MSDTVDVARPLVAVTGGARGIGRAIAAAFVKRGAHVVLGDLDYDLARSAAAELGAAGAHHLDAHHLDVRDRASFAAFLTAAGPVDVLVNNAGVAPGGVFVSSDPAALDCVIDVNLRGVVNGMRLALPDMIARGSGHIVNISSLSGRMPLAGAAAYTATKHAVVGLSEAVRVEIRASGVKVTSVLPTFAPTEIMIGLRVPGIAQVPVSAVADAVVRAVRRGGPPVVTVPRWLGVLPRVAAFMPYRLRDVLFSSSGYDADARADYERRVASQYLGPA
jgi:NADP-dependent 3-hydroxy acid dehydrogenase YdfG